EPLEVTPNVEDDELFGSLEVTNVGIEGADDDLPPIVVGSSSIPRLEISLEPTPTKLGPCESVISINGLEGPVALDEFVVVVIVGSCSTGLTISSNPLVTFDCKSCEFPANEKEIELSLAVEISSI